MTEPLPSTSAISDERPRRRVPFWVWIIAGVVAIVLMIVVVIAATRGTGGSPAPDNPSTSPTPSPSATPSESPTPSPTPDAGHGAEQGEFDSDMFEMVSTVLNSQNTAVLAQAGYFSDPIWVTAASSGQNGPLSPDDAVMGMDSMFTPVDPVPWDLALPESTLADYRAGPYGEYFPVGAIVARSGDGHVFSFIGHDGVITTMFQAASEGLLLP